MLTYVRIWRQPCITALFDLHMYIQDYSLQEITSRIYQRGQQYVRAYDNSRTPVKTAKCPVKIYLSGPVENGAKIYTKYSMTGQMYQMSS